MIDQWNEPPWPEAVTSRLGQFRQGSLVPSPPFAYHASTRHPIWQLTKRVASGTELVELDPADRPSYGMVTTQSCDIDEATGRPRKPWVQLAPVYELLPNDDRWGLTLQWRVDYLAPVSALGPGWVADLRIEIPVEKSWLILQTPRDGYTTPEEFHELARFLGRHRQRAALANEVHERVLTPLGNALKLLRRTDAALHDAFCTRVAHLYVATAGDRLAPDRVQLIFVSEAALAPDIREQLEAWWVELFGGYDGSFTVLRNRYLSFAEVSFAEQRTWVEQDLARLATGS